jgi:hypothetical protein
MRLISFSYFIDSTRVYEDSIGRKTESFQNYDSTITNKKDLHPKEFPSFSDKDIQINNAILNQVRGLSNRHNISFLDSIAFQFPNPAIWRIQNSEFNEKQ